MWRNSIFAEIGNWVCRRYSIRDPRWPFFHLIYIAYSASDTALSSTTTSSGRFTSESRCRSLAECHLASDMPQNSASQIQNKHMSFMETNDRNIYCLHSK